ncbi:MAG: LysM peptidoglycan-binding domain-containing protein [Anaerolineales bacterium]|nr:LysM peptidoglycan-binding domain-containing protein [Anaerolineales bacterium]
MKQINLQSRDINPAGAGSPAGDDVRRTYLTMTAWALVFAHLAVLLLAGIVLVIILLNTPGATDGLVQTTAFERLLDPEQTSSLLEILTDPEILFIPMPELAPAFVPETSPQADSVVSIEPIESVYSMLVTPLLPYQTSGVFYDPAGCRLPVGSSEIVRTETWVLSERSLGMLEHAVELYGGAFDPDTLVISRPSSGMNGQVRLPIRVEDDALFIDMLSQNGYEALYVEVDPLVRALRVAGFAAWFWDWDEQFLGSNPMIYAIPIGAASLSAEVEDLLFGDAGYFYGYRGIRDGQPLLDPHGGPIICAWMIDQGLASEDMVANLPRIGTPLGDWQTELEQRAATFITGTRKETNRLAREIGFLGGTVEDPSNMCGPLTAAILRDSNLIPSSVGPIRDPKSFWLANPVLNGRPWSLFPLEDYDLYQFQIPLMTFSFEDWPLCTGDILFTYAGAGEYSHVFVVTEIDSAGRAYSVTNQIQEDGSFLVERVLLYDPTNPSAGAFRNEWTSNPSRGRTGLGGFDVLRRIGSCLPPGTLVEYIVRAGDTLPTLAASFHSQINAILFSSGVPDMTTALDFGQVLRIPVNLQP